MRILKSVFYKNVLAKTVQTQINILCPIDFNEAENGNFCRFGQVRSYRKQALEDLDALE